MANSYTQLYVQMVFKEEYLALLKAFRIDYDDDYLYDWIE